MSANNHVAIPSIMNYFIYYTIFTRVKILYLFLLFSDLVTIRIPEFLNLRTSPYLVK